MYVLVPEQARRQCMFPGIEITGRCELSKVGAGNGTQESSLSNLVYFL